MRRRGWRRKWRKQMRRRGRRGRRRRRLRGVFRQAGSVEMGDKQANMYNAQEKEVGYKSQLLILSLYLIKCQGF
jgi:hypothetical protein